MYNKLAFKHKNSLALKEPKSLRDKDELKSLSSQSKPFRLISLPLILCILFISYWFILCPLIFSICYPIAHKLHWEDAWSFYFWIVALLIWIIILIILVSAWICLKRRIIKNKKAKSYGSDECEIPPLITSEKPNNLDTIRSKSESKTEDITNNEHPKSQPLGDIRDNEKKRHVLPPLSIHRHMSGNDIENTGDVTIENPSDKNDDDASLSKITDNVNRRSMKEYLTLVTLTPNKDEEPKTKSPPMSPRDLFFIDLIREAEKAESAGGKKENAKGHQHFFPDNASATSLTEDEGCKPNAKANEEALKESKPDCVDAEANYFIANIDGTSTEKTEVFLEIQPDENVNEADDCSKQWLVDLNEEKPVIVMETNSVDEENYTAQEPDMCED